MTNNPSDTDQLLHYSHPSDNQSPVIVFITTVAITAIWTLSGQLYQLNKKGYRVILITSPGEGLMQFGEQEGATVFTVPMRREISPFYDLIALFKLFFLIRKLKPTIVHSSSPKAGLLGMIASFMANVPNRIFQQRGLRLETTDGLKRKILIFTEKMTIFCAQHVVCNSHSLMAKLKQLKLTRKTNKYCVIGQGSSQGVDIKRFSFSSDLEKANIRSKYGVKKDDFVIGFVGRLTRDKGIIDLIDAFKELSKSYNDVSLMLVGGYEKGDPIPEDTKKIIKGHEKIHHLGFVDDAAETYKLMDVFVFPSYREGFPNAPLEASASGLPIIGYKVTGTVDAVVNGVTGLLIEPNNPTKLEKAIKKLRKDEVLRKQFGYAGRDRCVKEFDKKVVVKNWISYYDQFI